MSRINFFNTHGLTSEKLEELKIGPVIFREEAIFKREIKLRNRVEIDVELVKATPDFGQWTLRHNFIKEDGTLAALLTLDGAWFDIVKRKLTIPDIFVQNVFDAFPKSDDFQMVIKYEKQ